VKDELVENLDRENETHQMVCSWIGFNFPTEDIEERVEGEEKE
jgi:hypothetical protein